MGELETGTAARARGMGGDGRWGVGEGERGKN